MQQHVNINGNPCIINDPPSDKGAEKILQDAVEQLWQQWPFFATIIRQLEWKEACGLETIGVTMQDMIYDPKFLRSKPLHELVVILAHEACHIVMLHPLRLSDKDPNLYLAASDYAVNIFLQDCGLKLPQPCLLNVKYRNWLTEEIYEDLKQEAEKNGYKPDVKAMATMGTFVPETDENGKPLEGGARAEAEMEAQDKIREAITKGKEAGNMPGNVMRQLEKLANPDRSLHDILREYVAETLIPSDYSYARPNRRYMASGIVAPGIKKEHVGEIVLIIDNSGSIDAYALSLFNQTVKSILEDLNPAVAHVAYCDTRVHRWDSYDNGMIPDLDSTGGGGTDFRDPFIQVEKRGINPLVLIYFTDLECSSFAPAPSYPVIWAHWGGGGVTPSYGRVVSIRGT